MTIDMKTFSGGNTGSAAEGQQESNSYQREIATEDTPIYQELMEQASITPVESVINAPVQEPIEDRQKLNFEALRGEVEKLKAEREAERTEYRQNLDLLRANTMQQQPQKAPEPPKRLFEGLQKADIPNVGEIESALEAQIAQREANLQGQIEELMVAQRHPDYAEVLEKYLTPLIKEKPHLAQGIRAAENKALMAYELGKMAQSMKAQAQVPQPTQTLNSNAQRMVENARKPATLAQAGGQSVLSQADYYANMSDMEFMKMASKNLGEI